MNKISLIISREYMTRVKKKSFMIMTILGPVIFAALIILPAWFAQMKDTKQKTIAVIDSTGAFMNKIPETEYLKFEYPGNVDMEDMKTAFPETEYYAILHISHLVHNVPRSVRLFSDQQPTLGVKNHIENAIEKELERLKMEAVGIDESTLASIKSNVDIQTIKWTKTGEAEESHTEIAMIVGYISGFLIYFFIFLFGAQIMRGVLEEKTNRIVEVIISSVRPFQLMMGKIIGVGLVGLTQFILWVMLTFGFVTVIQKAVLPDMGKTPAGQEVTSQDLFEAAPRQAARAEMLQVPEKGEEDTMEKIFKSFQTIDFAVILSMFLVYFLGGYLLYASMFAAIGAAADQDTDTQQFMLPITIPLILAIIVMMNAIQNPGSSLAFWFSIIPFTSPIVMMVRIPFGVPYWEISLSVGLLIFTFIGTTWLSAKIYRTGILMYGKKVNYKELWKWLRYRG